jgi:hypothetical protein
MNQIEETLIMFFGLKPGGCYWICANELTTRTSRPQTSKINPARRRRRRLVSLSVLKS